MTHLRFLGTSDSQGVPRTYCTCSVCSEARTTGHNARTRPSVVLETASERILIDAAPELRLQLVREGITTLDAVLITHAHNDHILGLGDIGDLARWTGRTIPVYASDSVLPHLKKRFNYMTRGTYPALTPFHNLETSTRHFGGFTVSAHRVPHGANGHAYGFRFESERGCWAYLPDSLGLVDLPPWQNLQLLVLGTSFYQEHAPFEKRSVYDVVEASELIERLRPERTVLTHLGHGVDVRKTISQGLEYAWDGMLLRL